MTDFATNAREACNAIAEMLIAKNKAYGDSALNPLRVFSKGNPSEGIRLRIDDKISRIARGEAASEDTITDLIGYLIMLQIAERVRVPKPRAYDGAPLGDYDGGYLGADGKPKSEPIDGDCTTGTVSGVKTYEAGEKPAWCTKPGWNGFMVADVPRVGQSRIDLEAFKRQVEAAVQKAQAEENGPRPTEKPRRERISCAVSGAIHAPGEWCDDGVLCVACCARNNPPKRIGEL